MKSTSSFERRINQDSDERRLERGQYRSARNARVGTSQQDNVGSLESEASNAVFTGSYTFPAGTNRCIGTCADIKNNAIIYCFYNSNNNHRILRWDADTGVITDILDTDWNVAILGWTATTRLWNIRIVESGTDQLMFFHAVQGIPMRINLGIIAQRTTGAYTLTIDDISVARRPPYIYPTFEFQVDTDTKSNYISNKYFQFAYRYIYENGEITTWSPYSDISIPASNGIDYNKIVVTFNSGVKGVVKVQIARRQGNGESDTGTINPEWYIFNTWVKGVNSDSTNYTVDFFNTEVLIAVSRTQTNKSFNLVPQLVGCQEIVQSNQAIYGDITEGYDNISVNAGLIMYYDRLAYEFTIVDAATDYILIDNLPSEGDIVQIKPGTTSPSISYQHTLTGAEVATINAFGLYLTEVFNNYGIVVTWNAGTSKIEGTGLYNTVENNKFYAVYSAGYATLIEKTTNIFAGENGLPIASLPLILSAWIDVAFSLSAPPFFSNDNNWTSPLYKITQSAFYKWKINVRIKGTAASGTVSFRLYNNTTSASISVQTQNITTSYQNLEFDLDVWGGDYLGNDILVQIGTETNPGITVDIETTFTLTISSNASAVSKDGINLLRPTFKSGAAHKFGLVYYDDEMRQCGVQFVSEMRVPYFSERTSPQIENWYPYFIWEILHQPPVWAKKYQWVYSGANISDFTQFTIGEPTFDGDYVEFSVAGALYPPFATFKDFAKGQRVRVMYNVVRDTFNFDVFSITGVTDYYETEIESFDIATSKIRIINKNHILNSATFVENAGVEVFIQQSSEFYFEFGEVYNILNPGASNRYHAGPLQDQTATLPATGAFYEGDTYIRFRPQYINIPPDIDDEPDTNVIIESFSITDESESNFWNKGRPQIETPDQKQQRVRWMYRWGGQLLQGTQVNNMSSFDSGDYGIVGAKFGALTAMREVGYTLKMIQEANYNTAFIGRRELQNADGSTNLVVTDNLIGSVNPSEDLYGTKHPGSVCINGRNIYWLDTIKGKVIRESGNQPFPISDYGMVKYWRDASLTIDGLGYDVFTGFDKQTEQLFITYRRTGADVVTISFYDPERDGVEKGWISFHDFTKVISSATTPVDIYGWVGQIFTSALGNGLYKHNASGSYLQLYGEQKTMKVTSPFMLNPEQVTVFLAHWVRSNQKVSGTIFTIRGNEQTPLGMRSLLVPGNYVVKEGVYYSEIKRDGYTKGFFADDSPSFINQMGVGRVMRGPVLLAEISYSGSTIFVIFSHSVADDYSPLS
jgi:hypothetical protein